MSTRGPLQVSPSGLVFYYDTNNSKSYLGEPTTNFYTNADLTGGNNVGQEGGSNPTNTVILFPNPGNSPYCVRSTAVGGSIYTEYQLTVTGTIQANTTYCLSCWVAWTPDWDGTYSVFHMRWYNSSGGQAGASGLEQGTTVETKMVNGLTWYRKYYTFNSGASVNGTHDWYVGYYSNNTKGYRYFTNFQLEAKDHPTQFSKGTRSVTEGLVDLAGNCTVNLNSSSFDSAANITFGGSNCITVDDTPAIALSGDKSFCMWIYFDQDASCGFGGKSNGTVSGMSLGYGWSGGGFMALAWNTANSPALAKDSRDYKKWVYLAAVQNGSTRYIYAVDAIGIRSASSSGGTHSWSNSLPLKIGRINDHAQVPSGTKIGEVSVYNRALTQSEVLQNFNRSKSRFGL